MSRSLTALWVALLAAIAVIVTLAHFWNVQREQIAIRQTVHRAGYRFEEQNN